MQLGTSPVTAIQPIRPMDSNFSQMLALKSYLHSVFPLPLQSTNTCDPHGSVYKGSGLTGDESVTAPDAEPVPSLLPGHYSSLFHCTMPRQLQSSPCCLKRKPFHFCVPHFHTPHGFYPRTIQDPTNVEGGLCYSKNVGTYQGKQAKS